MGGGGWLLVGEVLDQMKIRLTQSSLTKHWALAELGNFQSQKIRAASKISELLGQPGEKEEEKKRH